VSRYVILLILNGPFIIAGLINAVVNYKMSKISKQRFYFYTVMWILVFIGLASLQPIYNYLFSNKLTQTEPLSLFDVMQITGIVVIFFIANRSRTKLEALERRVQDLHQELSIRMSDSPVKVKPVRSGKTRV
jgi:hypothetical protein